MPQGTWRMKSTATQDSNGQIEKLLPVEILDHQRKRLYPTLYGANTNVQQILDQFAVDYFLEETDDDNNDEVALKPAPKQLKQHQPSYAVVVEDAVSKYSGLNDATSGPDSTSFNDITGSNGNEASKFYAEANTGNVPDKAINQSDNGVRDISMSIDIMAPSEIPSSSRSTGNDAAPDVPPSVKPSILQPVPAVVPSSLVRDIWGHIPPKEYIPATSTSNNNNTTSIGSEAVPICMMICSICQQKVGSSLRYASHLDKCLGIGTMSRNTSSNTSSLLHNNNNASS